MKEIEPQCSWLADVGLLRHPEYFAADFRRSTADAGNLAVRRRDGRPLGGLRVGNKKSPSQYGAQSRSRFQIEKADECHRNRQQRGAVKLHLPDDGQTIDDFCEIVKAGLSGETATAGKATELLSLQCRSDARPRTLAMRSSILTGCAFCRKTLLAMLEWTLSEVSAFATQPRGVHPPEDAPPSADSKRKNFEHIGESEVFVKRLSRSGNALAAKGCDFRRTLDEITVLPGLVGWELQTCLVVVCGLPAMAKHPFARIGE